METVLENNIVTNSLTTKALPVIELLEGVSTHADKGKSALHALNSVQLLGGAGQLKARATDRYRLIEGEVEGEGHLDHTLITLEDTKRVIELLKSNKVGLVSLNRIGDLLTVSVSGSSITLKVLEANYPNSFADLLNKSEREQLGEISFNPAFMADYAKIAGKGNAVRLEFMGDRKPMIVHLPKSAVSWKALIMPMRVI
jgi:DNA polymerase III sliding clamp (beta) subunit (PCNA family)